MQPVKRRRKAMEILWENRSMLSLGILSQTMMFVIINLAYGKRERPWVFALTNALHFILVNVVFDLFMKQKYGQELWFLFFFPIIGNVLAYAVVAIQAVNWRENFIKLLLAFMLADVLCSMTSYFVYLFTKRPAQILFFGLLFLLLFCLLFSDFLKGYRKVKLYHPWLVGGIILYTTLQGTFSRLLYVLQDENIISDALFFIGVCNTIFAAVFLLIEYTSYYLILRRKYQMLLRNKDQMEDYYRQVARHIREIDETRLLLEQGAKLLTGGAAGKVETTETAGESNLPSEELRAHLHRLTEQYEALGEVFFCSDFAVDSVLRDFVRTCRRQGIRTDILFHEYHREKVSAGDAAAILSRMLDYGIKTAEDCRKDTRISVHGATVKNQLLFSMTVSLIPKEKDPEETQMKNPEGNKAEDQKKDQTENQEKGMENEKKKEKKISDGKKTTKTAEKTLRKIPVRKRSFFPWIRKYNGIIHVQREEKRVQMVVGLENGIYD